MTITGGGADLTHLKLWVTLIAKHIQNTQELTSDRLRGGGLEIISLQMKRLYIGSVVESAHSQPLISVCQLPSLFIVPLLPAHLQSRN